MTEAAAGWLAAGLITLIFLVALGVVWLVARIQRLRDVQVIKATAEEAREYLDER